MPKNHNVFDVIVIGAGLHGSSAALHLAKRNLRVLMLDQGSGGRNSSKANAGGLRQLMRLEPEIPLAIEAIEMWRHIEELVGDHCGVAFDGQIFVAEDQNDLIELNTRQKRMSELGYTHEELIDAHELKKLVPSISERCVGGIICRNDGFGSPFRSTLAFQKKAVSSGATFLSKKGVSFLDKKNSTWMVTTKTAATFEAPIVVNCAGAWGDKIASMVGDTVPISAEAPTMMVTAPIDAFLKPVVCGVSRKLSFKQAPNGTVLIGGGYRSKLDRDTRETWVDFEQLKLSAQTVIDFFPHMAQVPVVRSWAGIEGLTPDRMPIIGKSLNAEGIVHSFGYSSHGYLLAPITGKLLAELIVDDEPSLSIAAFDPCRFEEKNAQKQSASISGSVSEF